MTEEVEIDTSIVLYLMDGTFHATRHAEGCWHLARALKAAAGEVAARRGDRPEVWDEDQYPYRSGPEPHDCACVAKATAKAKETML